MMMRVRKRAFKAMVAAAAVVLSPFVRADLADAVTFSNAATNWVDGDLVLVYSNTAVSGTLRLSGRGYGRFLAVGGGGAGATYSIGSKKAGSGGGGGGGGVVATNDYFFLPGDTYTIKPGAGGAAATSATTLSRGNDGKSSTISYAGSTIVTAYGGGGGGAHSNGNRDDSATRRGCGGGGSSTARITSTGGAGTSGQGYNGGNGVNGYAGGGGGGAGAKGMSTAALRQPGDGGAGRMSDITGEEIYYGGGGGGGLGNVGTGAKTGKGGNGGGGRGGTPIADAESGVDGLGGGGGGCGGSPDDGHTLGGAGGSGVVIVRISEVISESVTKPVPQTIVYDGNLHTIMRESKFAYSIRGTAKATNVGNFTFTVTLKPGFYWNGNPSDTAPVTINWSIEKSSNFISNLYIDNWEDGDLPSTPTCDHGPGTVVYTYSDGKTGNYSSKVPTEIGDYWLKAEIFGTGNYDGAGPEYCQFSILQSGRSPVKGTGKFAEVSVDSSVFTTNYTGFPLLVRISAGSPEGFDYSQVKADGSDIRFCSIDRETLYPHEIDTWDPEGTSLIWVRIPELTGATKFYMCWGKQYNVEMPSVLAADVWSDYVGVWHFNEKISRAEATTGEIASADSSGNGLDAMPAMKQPGKGDLSRQVSTNGVLGLARVNADNKASGDVQGNVFKVPNYKELGVIGAFTFSGWVNVYDYWQSNPCIISRKDGHSVDYGWELKLWGNADRSLLAASGGGEATSPTPLSSGLKGRGYVHLALAYMGSKLVVYENGSPIATNDIVDATNPALPLYLAGSSYDYGVNATGAGVQNKTTPLWAALDEFRILGSTADNDWIKADYEQAMRNVTTFGEIQKGKGALLENRWTTEPSISKSSWYVGDEPGVITAGTAVNGEAAMQIVNLADGSVLDAMPTEEGAYRAIFTIPAEGEYGDFTSFFDFDILVHSSYVDLTGLSDDISSSGRVLLMNRDLRTDGSTVENQGYYERDTNGNTQTNRTTFWHIDVNDTASGYNLQNGTAFTLWTRGYGKKLWRLFGCRHGNTFPTSSSGLLGEQQNYLYWSSTSKRINAHNNTPANRNTVGQCVMQNVDDAAICSPCYDDGIGTIYFDTVNGWNSNVTADDESSPYRIVVEVATNVVGTQNAPYDNQIVTYVTNWDVTEHDDGTVTTNGYTITTNEYGGAAWFPVAPTLYKMDWDGADESERVFQVTNAEAGAFALSVVNGGTTGNFYRVVVPLNITCPARFRIRRVSIDATKVADNGAMILFDNIIASYPSMRADLNPFGIMKDSLYGKQILGQEVAFNVPFPAIGEEGVYGRAWANYVINGSQPGFDPNELVTSARMCYRWRYLDQQTDEWKRVRLDKNNDFTSMEPLDVPKKQGDMEFFYEIGLNAPYYKYVDYSGHDLGVPGYSEAVEFVTNRANTAYQSGGTDWFVRLRDGKSDYEALNLVVVYIDEEGELTSVTNTVEMELVGDHVWRGYLKTVKSDHEDAENYPRMRYHFEALNKQEAGSTGFSENRAVWWPNGDAMNDWPMSGLMEVCTDSDWREMDLDYATGYLMFQVDDNTLAVTAVHADYQNFNGWNDAKKSVFVGSSTEDESKTGASGKSVTIAETFERWLDMPATNIFWEETFTSSNALSKADYVPFTTAESPNGWTAGPGMWIAEKYRDSRIGRAFQMKGLGEGYLQFVDSALSPRGLESVSFSARVAQFVEFGDFCYLDCENKSQLKNYTVVARGAFDLNQCKSFAGNGTLSLVAYHIPGEGCYEFRIEQALCENTTTRTNFWKRGQVFSLYRWRVSDSGRISGTCLGVVTNYVKFGSYSPDFPETSGESGQYMPLYLSVSNTTSTTCIMAGYRKDGTPAPSVSHNSAFCDNRYFNNIVYTDDTSDRLTYGTMGVVIANCEGVLLKPTLLSKPIPYPGNFTAKRKIDVFSNKNLGATFPKEEYALYGYDEVAYGNWRTRRGRTRSFAKTQDQWGLQGYASEQKIGVYTAPSGTTAFNEDHPLAVTNFSSFGTSTSLGENCTFNLYSTDDCSVRIATIGDIYDMRTDVVIDNVSIRQWRGEDWNNKVGESFSLANYVPYTTFPDDQNYRCLTNFSFYSGWIKDESILLSAKRTKPGTPCALKSPVFDGAYGRGIGLGMIAFEYRDAQPNVNLYVQIATNFTDYTYVKSLAEAPFEDERWVNVTNFPFSGLPASERAYGFRSCYFGMHGVKGMARIIMDPKVVDSVANETDESKFGDIYITEAVSRDEPMLDTASWWGWNLRTIGTDNRGFDSENRMYLPDYTVSAAKMGLSLALNDSVEADVDELQLAAYTEHLPFVQSPTFGTNLVGEIAFKARRYNANADKPALLRLYGSLTGQMNDRWTPLKDFYVTNSVYEIYSYKTEPNEAYTAFRLAVPGVEGVTGSELDTELPAEYGYFSPARALIDEIVISEAVRAKMAFKNVGAFRTALDTLGPVPNVPSESEQPLCGEAWGVQCEVYPAQLPEDIDLAREPRVRLSWYPAKYPWGYDNWRTNDLAQSAWLRLATGGELVYRSGYLPTPAGIVDSTYDTSGTVYQFMLEVVYYMKGGDKPVTNRLMAADWEIPAWYTPVNYNEGESSFSAFNILDTVAPHWAWINEININGYGTITDEGEEIVVLDNNDQNQFVEIAVPAEADITGWELRSLDGTLQSDPSLSVIVTNVLARFGDNVEPKKADNIGMASNMVFRVVATPYALPHPEYGADYTGSDIMKAADGTLDGIWNVEYGGTTLGEAGVITYYTPIAFQLVRPTGIVEHEVACCGSDAIEKNIFLSDLYAGTNFVDNMNKVLGTTNMFFVGYDSSPTPADINASAGVFAEKGASADKWNTVMKRTPGRINEGQVINPDHPTPNGSSVLITFAVDQEFGHITQTVGEAVDSVNPQVLVVQKGSETGTNVTYRVDPWFELAQVTTNGSPVDAEDISSDPVRRTYTVNVGVGVSNNVTVVGSAQLKESLKELGVTDDNPYKDAIVDWFSKRRSLYGDWANPDSDELKLAKYWPYGGDKSRATDLTVNEMYWLDMDPTVGDLYLRGGIVDPAHEVGDEGNVRIKIGLYITNATEDVTNPRYGQEGWSPYVLRGLAPGEISWDYENDTEWSWTSVTFKVSGLLMTGGPGVISDDASWLPLRYFVFHADSFDSDHNSEIDIKNPLGTDTPGYSAGWKDWVDEHGVVPVFYRWSIDTERKPFLIEVLQQENRY